MANDANNCSMLLVFKQDASNTPSRLLGLNWHAGCSQFPLIQSDEDVTLAYSLPAPDVTYVFVLNEASRSGDRG